MSFRNALKWEIQIFSSNLALNILDFYRMDVRKIHERVTLNYTEMRGGHFCK
jgi:hypothetical protein